MNKEALLDELDRLLSAGEPLLTAFPTRFKNYLELPDNITSEMGWYADEVSFLASLGTEQHQTIRRQYSLASLTKIINCCETGLLGWRSIGVLR